MKINMKPSFRESLYLVNRTVWERIQASDKNPLFHDLVGYGHHQFTVRQFQHTLSVLLRDTELFSEGERQDPGPLVTFYSESHALEQWGDARVPVMGMWPNERNPVVVYARGGGEAPAHRMEFYATQVTKDAWEEAEAEFAAPVKDAGVGCPVYNHTMHTVAQRLFTLFSNVWNNIDLEPEDIFPVFNVHHDEWSLDALKMMARGRQPAWTDLPVWEGQVFYPEHPKSAAGYAEAVDDASWAFHSALHYPAMEDRPEQGAVNFTDREVEPDPTWKDRRTVLHVYLGSQRDDYWVDSTKCPNCHQRLIIHADKAQCPTGTPNSLTVKCPGCKGVFPWP